jgi:phage terminase large subunit
VALVNTLIRAALDNTRLTPPPRYAYIGPSFDQTKDLCWAYLKEYTANIPGVRSLEGELSVIFPGGASIRLYGGGLAYERLRGIYLDGAVLDILFSPRLHSPLSSGPVWLITLVSPLSAAPRMATITSTS